MSIRTLAAPKKQNEASILMAKHLAELGVKAGAEFEFAPPRKWRFDFAFTCKRNTPERWGLVGDMRSYKVAIEIEGGVFAQGRHTRGAGFTEDCIKYCHAAAMGYCVFRFTTSQVLSGYAKEFISKFLEGRT
jgi:hypothetical protein